MEAYPGDRRVKLVWGTDSEKDPQFEGYKIYRSEDRGITWGSQTFKDFEGGIHYIPLAQFDKENGITGYYKSLPEFAWFYLGDDDWVDLRQEVTVDTFNYFKVGDSINVFIDNNVTNGIRYRYYIAAYDSGNGIVGPLENSYSNRPEDMNNTVELVPHSPLATSTLDEVRVVPNPYIVAEIWEQGIKDHQIQFVNLPERATIRIFNASGELLRTLEHNALGALAPSIAAWDLKNEFNQLAAPGVYFYHISSPLGEKTGKFIIVL